ncbi:hypothetical protein DSO57_1034333 [Entomophthora muscae]|uniref:Uncharacterized protein n=1 Tax=Entomophthora muscae TaxID=34485 RepID=A0ACC2TM29_9FUNG|nr:hypothetical protein DSO57_1034333 [Entomophthora muscae]
MSLHHYLDPSEFQRSLAKHVPFGGYHNSGKVYIAPRIDVQEAEQETVIQAEMPGVKKGDIHLGVSHDGGSLVLKGSNAREEKIQGHLLIHERHVGSFERTIRLPAGSEVGKVKAKFDDGILSITVPKGIKDSCSEIEIE